MITHYINGKEVKEIFLEYLQGKTFVSLGELVAHCTEPIRDPEKPPPTPEDNFLFFVLMGNVIKELADEKKIIYKEVENDIWVKSNENTN